MAEVLTAPASRGDSSPADSGAGGAVSAGGGNAPLGGFSGSPATGGEDGGGAPADPTLGMSLSAGQSHNCLARSGLVYCWGGNRDGQLGLGDNEARWVPTLVPGSARVVQVSVGEEHSCWLDVDGAVSCFGSNEHGQLGTPDVTATTAPQRVRLPDAAEMIDANYGHTCAVLRNHELYCWGENAETQLGQGDAPDVDQFEPILVEGAGPVVSVSCGQGHTAALDEAGTILAWGRNSAGEAGLGEGQPRVRQPTVLTDAGVFDLIDSGQSSSCALQPGGSLSCWGGGSDLHLGTGSDATEWSPIAVTAGFVWRQVSTDTFHTCGIDEEARLFCWGRAIEGQLGSGEPLPPQPEPTQLAGSWQAVSTGRFHTCAITTDQRLWCTGYNAEGELGVGDTDKRFTFTEVALP